MRNPRTPAWARCVFAAALLVAVAGLAPGASAQEKFKQLFVFGDSYADLTLSDMPALNPEAFPPLTGFSFGFWRVYPVSLQKDLGIPSVFDFAVGGARAWDTPPPATIPPGWHLHQQVEEFLKRNQTLGPRDLVTLSIGGNDGIGFAGSGGTVGDAPAFGAFIADLAAGEIQRLRDAGGQTFVIAGFSGLSGLQVPQVTGNAAAADAFGASYFEALQQGLLPMAQSGTRFFLLDLHRLGQQVEANFAAYGLASNQKCPIVPSPLICGGSIDSPEQNQYFLGPDGLHLTNRGFEIVAAYMANIVMAPDTIAVQPDIVKATASSFTSSVLDRLGGTRQLASVAGITVSGDADGPMGLGLGSGSRTPRTSGRFTSYALGNLFGGNRDESVALAGYEYDGKAGTAGIEYSLNRNLIVGIAGNYTDAQADLTSGADVGMDAVQAAAYLSYATRHVFADMLLGIGSHDIDMVRPGVISPVRGETDAVTFSAAARGGYLFDFGRLRAGPIAGLTYIHARVDGYTETGDPLLTFDVSAQTLESLTGHVGLRFLAPFRNGDNVVIPYLNVTLEHQLGDDTRTLTTSLTQAPLLPILSPVATFDARTYGRVEGGITMQLDPGVGATVNASSTFARDDANDFRIGAGVNFRF
jgi:uncharacterized protein YhjY with autotransporter beta-barrel domain/phospholipase/lecithinase/hemolysin